MNQEFEDWWEDTVFEIVREGYTKEGLQYAYEAGQKSRTPDMSKLDDYAAIRQLAVAICQAEGMDWGKIGTYDADLFEKQAKAAIAEIKRILCDN